MVVISNNPACLPAVVEGNALARQFLELVLASEEIPLGCFTSLFVVSDWEFVEIENSELRPAEIELQ